VVEFNFDCANSEPAPVSPGVNTLLLSASATPVSDIIALAATAGEIGLTVDIPGTSGSVAFAVATVNVGARGSITASVDTGNLPLSATLCQTDPQTSLCMGTPTPTVTIQIDAGETPTFGIFLTASGETSFDPANNRVFVRFKNGGDIERGSTSVAVRTRPETSTSQYAGNWISPRDIQGPDARNSKWIYLRLTVREDGSFSGTYGPYSDCQNIRVRGAVTTSNP